MPDLVALAAIIALLVSILRLLGWPGRHGVPENRNPLPAGSLDSSDPGGTDTARNSSAAGLSAEYARLDTVGKIRQAIRLRDEVFTEWTEYVEDIRSVY